MTTLKAQANVALIIVDPQNDFCPGGNLAVTEGDRIMPVINAIKPYFQTTVITQDWHPEGHSSFASSHEGKNPFETTEMPYGTQVLWPDHCIQGSEGAKFHPDLEVSADDLIIQKGTHLDIDSYSAIYENDRTTQPRFDDGQSFDEKLREQGVDTLVFTGLAFDYCVGWCALDAAAEGFDVIVVEDASRSIAPESEAEMRQKLQDAGVQVVNSNDLPTTLGLSRPNPPGFTPG